MQPAARSIERMNVVLFELAPTQFDYRRFVPSHSREGREEAQHESSDDHDELAKHQCFSAFLGACVWLSISTDGRKPGCFFSREDTQSRFRSCDIGSSKLDEKVEIFKTRESRSDHSNTRHATRRYTCSQSLSDCQHRT